MPDPCLCTLYYHWRNRFLFILDSSGPRSLGDTPVKLQQRRRRRKVLTRYPRHELQGPQDTHSPEGPQVHVCVEVGSCRGQDAAGGDTEGQGYHNLAFSPWPGGEAGLRRDQPGKHTVVPRAAARGRTWAWVNHCWFWLELNLATSGFYFAQKENLSSHQNPSSRSWIEHWLPSICPIPASKPCPLLSSLFLTNLLALFPTCQGPWVLYFSLSLDSPVC